jgi:hypothetical protein
MSKSLVYVISEKAEALVGAPNDFNSLIDLIGDARFVLIGEASHGTHEFYRIRADFENCSRMASWGSRRDIPKWALNTLCPH